MTTPEAYTRETGVQPEARGRLTRRKKDRAVFLHSVLVAVWEADDAKLDRLVARSTAEPLCLFTPQMHKTEPHWATMPRMHGDPMSRCQLEKTLTEMHRIGKRRKATEKEWETFWYWRVMARVEDDLRLATLISGWQGWPRILNNPGWIGDWHGDPTQHNSVGAWLVDHSPEWQGPFLYDMAKARRCELIDNDLVLKDNPKYWRTDPYVIAVIAGMLANHRNPELEELWKELIG